MISSELMPTAESMCCEIEKCVSKWMSVQGRLQDIKVIDRDKWRSYRTQIFHETQAQVRLGTFENLEKAASSGCLFAMCVYYSFCVKTETEIRPDILKMLENRLKCELAFSLPTPFLSSFAEQVTRSGVKEHSSIVSLCSRFARAQTPSAGASGELM